jgi:Mg-chelatase subunit ChlD
MRRLFFLFIYLSYFSSAFSQLQFSDVEINVGNIEAAYQIKAVITLTNLSEKTVYLMRADVDKQIAVQAINKKLLPNDTTSVFLTFTPQKSGKFKSIINIIASDRAQPYKVTWNGELKNWKQDDKTACYYFKKQTKGTTIKEEPIVVAQSNTPRDVSNKIPDNSTTSTFTGLSTSTVSLPKTPDEMEDKELPLMSYKPNNILFLVDVSSSMKDSLKLPLMKIALYRLVEALRDVDKVSFVTYADSVKIINESISGNDKEQLKKSIQLIKAKGLTKGNKAILASIDLLIKHYIAEGNNQIILATDGEFRMVESDYTKWMAKTTQHPIIVTTVGFGNEKPALKNLKNIANKGKGSFIHIKSKKNTKELLLEEIKLRSKR